MLVHPWFPRVTAEPQYSQVMTISPNLGEMGAPQLGHFKAVTPEGAITGEVGVTDDFGAVNPVFAPHLGQTAASSGT